MQEARIFHHALKVDEELCYGCTRCMSVCPTTAIRIRRGKAVVDPARCIDCGNCMEACPVDAIVVEQDDFQKIFRYAYRVAVVPSVMIGQFKEEISESRVINAIHELGFTHVYEAEFGTDILHRISGAYPIYAAKGPIISSFCPAIVQLVQVRFPSLVSHLNLIKPPLDISAHFAQRELIKQGARQEEIGIFYVTPCAAKIAAIKSPAEEESGLFNGVINMNFLFNLVRKTLVRQKKTASIPKPDRSRISPAAVTWSLTNGEAPHMKGRSLSVDGIHNVIEFLEKLESGEITGIDFLELRSCDEGCAGGILGSGNRFLTAERLRHRADSMKALDPQVLKRVDAQEDYLSRHIKLAQIRPRSIVKLDDDFQQAMRKMERIQELLGSLPRVDCGVCGSPSCEALAQDIVQGRGELNQCIFYQRSQEVLDPLRSKRNLEHMRRIWGSGKFSI
ncbi:MAG TPA: 4Fe-4S dicluster domain-containing protein [Sediminispirochaeta sp.]|nr:4Fe-4S dicluster domain-containing protein [Sediminispirochaeta sp.]